MADNDTTNEQSQAQAEEASAAAPAQPAVGLNTVATAPPVPESSEAQEKREEAERIAEQAAEQAKEEGFVNALGQPRVTPAPDPEAAFGALPAPKYETPQDELGTRDPLAGVTPGSPLSAALDTPESPHLGRRYVPGSANTTAETDLFRGVPNSPPRRG